LVDKVARRNVLLFAGVEVNHLDVAGLVVALRALAHNNVTALVVRCTVLVFIGAVVAVVHHVFRVDWPLLLAMRMPMTMTSSSLRSLSSLMIDVCITQHNLSRSLIIHHAGEIVTVMCNVNLFLFQLSLFAWSDVPPLLCSTVVVIEFPLDWSWFHLFFQLGILKEGLALFELFSEALWQGGKFVPLRGIGFFYLNL